MLFKIHSPFTQNLCLCGHERAAAASGSNLPPKTLEMLSCGNRGKQQSGRMMHQLCSTLFCQYQLLGMYFLTPESRSWCRDCTAWATTRAAENLLLGCLFYFPPTHWLKCCSLVISQAQVYRQLTSHSRRFGEKNIRRGMSGA